MNHVLELLAWYLVFLLSTSFHEAAHAWTALRLGDPTAYAGGQVSLDPTPHVRREPVGMIVLPWVFLLTLGWPLGFASAPVDLFWMDRHPRRAAWVALAGPLANLTLVILSVVLVRIGMALGELRPPLQIGHLQDVVSASAAGEGSIWTGVALILSVTFSLNLILMLFNLLPIPPMDGSGAAGLFMRAETARRFQVVMRQPLVGLLGILFAWTVFPELLWPIFSRALRLMYS